MCFWTLDLHVICLSVYKVLLVCDYDALESLIDAYVSTFKPQMASRSSDFAVSATVVCKFSAMPDL